MYKTREIRWFFEQENQHVLQWFRAVKFDAFEQRKDVYLQLTNEDIGIKLREGNIEIKHRIAERARGRIHPNATGYFEQWVKWSFGGEKDDPIYSRVLKGNHDCWVDVSKERFAVQLAQENERMVIYPLSHSLDHGCQIEYSKVFVMGEKWYTFGLEWFGKTETELAPHFISEILGDTKLSLNESMGYAALLKQYQKWGDTTLTQV